MISEFWRKLSAEYFSSLQLPNKWRTDNVKPAVDDIVIIKEDSSPPMYRLLASITQTFAGNDYIVRVVQVKTQTGVYITPATRFIRIHRQEPKNFGAN